MLIYLEFQCLITLYITVNVHILKVKTVDLLHYFKSIFVQLWNSKEDISNKMVRQLCISNNSVMTDNQS